MSVIHTPTISASQLANTSPEEFALHLAGEPEQAALWIRAAADQGMPDAQALMGQILLDGHGVSQDETQARYWFGKAAAQGHLMGINMLGRCYELGWGGEIDAPAAAIEFKRAAEQGMEWGMYNYANLLLRGNGVDKNETEALNWYRKASALGNAKSLNVIGRFYEEGWLVEADHAIAADYYRQAAEGGDFRGQYNFALLLAEQNNMPDAIYWLHRALDGAHLRFSRTMASTLLSFPKPEFRQIALLAHEKCCQLGETEDYFAYGQALLNDKSKPANTILARTWLMRAAAQGHQQARQQLAALTAS
jgi:TPR repeat protein